MSDTPRTDANGTTIEETGHESVPVVYVDYPTISTAILSEAQDAIRLDAFRAGMRRAAEYCKEGELMFEYRAILTASENLTIESIKD